MPISVRSDAQEAEGLTSLEKNGKLPVTVHPNQDKENPLSCGFFITYRDNPITFNHPYSVFILIVDGEYLLEDKAKPGEQIIAKAGDVVHVDKGTIAKFSTPTQGKGFYVNNARQDQLDYETYIV